MQPHRIWPWQKAIHCLVDGRIQALENYDVEVSSPSVSFQIPSVARITGKIPYHKRGVKFSRINVLTRDNFTCQYCGNRFPRRKLNYDHVIPRSKGGKTVWENIVSACYPCNAKKRNRTPEQAGMHLIRPAYRPQELPLTTAAFPIDQAPEAWKFYLQDFKVFGWEMERMPGIWDRVTLWRGATHSLSTAGIDPSPWSNAAVLES